MPAGATPHVNLNADGRPMRINGQSVPYGIGTHANSLIVYDLPSGYTRFKARAGLDNGGTDQGNPSPSSVRFFVFTEAPPRRLVANTGGGGGGGGGQVDHDPAKATSYLDVADGLEVTLFCSEPQMTNPTNIDIDPLGRVWVCDVQNYRGHNGLRPAGDRILVMQDTNGEGKADKVTTFLSRPRHRCRDGRLRAGRQGDRFLLAECLGLHRRQRRQGGQERSSVHQDRQSAARSRCPCVRVRARRQAVLEFRQRRPFGSRQERQAGRRSWKATS